MAFRYMKTKDTFISACLPVGSAPENFLFKRHYTNSLHSFIHCCCSLMCDMTVTNLCIMNILCVCELVNDSVFFVV